MTEDLQVVQQKSQLAIPVIGHLVFWLRCSFLDCSARRDCWKAIALAELQPLRSNSVKNLFCGTGRSILRKGAEFTLVPVAEFVLGKRRILEIYLNVVEWGPGIYGAESACRYYDGTAARNVGREQAARLAAILPAPLKRRPERMNNYSARILERMRQMGW
jgi:hypothetical protein